MMQEERDRHACISERHKSEWETYYHGETRFSYACKHCMAAAPFYYMSKQQMKTRYCYNCGSEMINYES